VYRRLGVSCVNGKMSLAACRHKTGKNRGVRRLRIACGDGDQEKTGAIPTSHRMSTASLVAEATASRAIPRSKHGLDLA
jgi:hypothetical protein